METYKPRYTKKITELLISGRFVQLDERPKLVREYHYKFSTSLKKHFIEWYDYSNRNGIEDRQMALIYVEKPYLTAIDVTERRNLVYTFRSLVSRNVKGSIVAGIYFSVKQSDSSLTNLHFTARFLQNGFNQLKKISFSEFLPNKVLLNSF